MPSNGRADRSGRATGPAALLRDADLDLALAQPHRIGGDIHHRWQQKRLTGTQVEPRPMTRTNDLVTIHLAIAERPVVVRADIADGKDLTGHVEQHDRFALDFDEQALAGRDPWCARYLQAYRAGLLQE